MNCCILEGEAGLRQSESGGLGVVVKRLFEDPTMFRKERSIHPTVFISTYPSIERCLSRRGGVTSRRCPYCTDASLLILDPLREFIIDNTVSALSCAERLSCPRTMGDDDIARRISDMINSPPPD